VGDETPKSVAVLFYRIHLLSEIVFGEGLQSPAGIKSQLRASPQPAQAATRALHHRHGAQPAGLEPAGPEVSTLSRDEAGLFDGATATAIEDRETLGIVGLDSIGIDVHHQLADLAAGSGGRHLKKSEGHPRNAPACSRRQGPRSGPA